MPAPSRLRRRHHRHPAIEAFMLTYNTHMAHPFEWNKGVRFYERLKDKLAARSTFNWLHD